MKWAWPAAVTGVAVCIVVVAEAGTGGGGILGLAVIVGWAVWRFSHCQHPGPLGLLPPVANADGTSTLPQWYCDRCGRTWVAHFEHHPRFVQRFKGYDESKAADAARRAGELEKRQRTLALRRAGMEPKPRPKLRPAAEVVPMAQVHRFGK